MKAHQNLDVNRAIADALEAIGSDPGASKRRPGNYALAPGLARRATNEIGYLCEGWLDCISRAVATIRRDGELLRDGLSQFVLFQLTVTPLPEGNKAALAIELDRFAASVGQGPRKLASGKSTPGEATDMDARS
ncbi:CopG family transcriptional regulator [Sphingomonas qomolangmaensis]|uniref:CopG family transcriptional regulator n=1 Tax=Sphingomonas qomolangmaensis TaxID=2918765 RepID=A0ABY5L9X5_9SPHN|nr:CopG family transcriptional regulator [Sphingomonas qomolangmaensis]UUL82398.1 CopG family transcriptional regulator [Sphingomonas qomolangmaensis]